MPRVRTPAEGGGGYQAQLAAMQADVGGLGLLDDGGAECSGSGAADAVVDSFAAGQGCRAYGHDARIFDLAFHPASPDLLVSASDDCTAGVWRRQDGAAASARYMQVAAFRGHADSVMRAAWSPDGRMVATGSSDGVVCLWQPLEAALVSRRNLGHAGVRQLGALEGHPEEVYACLFLQPSSSSSSSSGSGGGSSSSSSSVAGSGGAGAPPERLVTASGESLFLWDLATQRQLQQVAPAPPPEAAAGAEHQVPERWRAGYLFGLAAQPDGPLLGAACSDGRLRLWSRGTGDASLSPFCTLPWNQAMGSDCCFGPGGLFCAVSKDGSVIMMDVRQGACLQHLRLEAPLLSCTLLPDGRGGQCLVAAGADGGVHFVDAASGEVASLLPEEGPHRPLLCATLSADGSTLAASGEAVVLGEHDLPAGEPQAAAAAPGHQRAPKWSPIHLWQRAQQRR